MDSIPSLQLRPSQVPSSRSSLSCPSEPPDVGNWFSTYEYQSPDPDSNFSLEEGEKEANFERIKARDEVVVREKLMQCSETFHEVKDDNHEDLCLTKNMDSFSSSPLFSEPPDIRNWFSSYVYESSVSDTISPSKDEVSEEIKCGDERFDFEVMNGGRSENVHPKGCAEHNSSSDKTMKGDGSSELKKNLSTTNTCHLEKILQQSVQDRTLQCNLGPTKYEETLSLNQGSLGCNQEALLMPLGTNKSAIRPPKLVQKNDTREAKPKDEIQHDKVDMSASLTKSFSARSSNCTANKENDGFVTTRRNSSTGANDENSWKKPEKISLQCSTDTRTAPLACEQRAAVTKRKALTEATNLQQSNAMEITGKWQCPQKRKPNTGPALKQLRLERWSMLLQKRQFFHSHRVQPMALEQVLSDRDSEDEVDDDIADLEDRRMLDDFVDVSKDEKQLMHLWNSFMRKQRVLADGHVPWACEAFSKLYGKELISSPALFWCWRLFMIKLWNHGLLDACTMNNCNIVLDSYRNEGLDTGKNLDQKETD